MTTHPQKKTCALCGTEDAHEILASASIFGSPDLDTRPPETRRAGLFTDVQKCRSCGYCAIDVSKPSPGAETVVESSQYRRQLHDDAYPYLANEFLCMSMVNRAANDYAGATWALIQAAWACDDEGSDANAMKCRSKAADMLVSAEEHGQSLAKQDGAGMVILVDLLRRSGRGDDARTVIDQRPVGQVDEIIVKVLQYQEKLLARGDTSCHKIAEAIDVDEEAAERV